MTTVTTAQVRVFCDMASNFPVDATITAWITDNLAIITQSYPSVSDSISNVIIKNRISVVYAATRTQGVTNSTAAQAYAVTFPALSKDEKAMLGDERKTYWT